MRKLHKCHLKVRQMLGGVANGLLLLGVACGAGATATPLPTDTPQPTVVQVATRSAPTAADTATPMATPIAAPKPTPGPKSVPVVGAVKVTLMISSFGNERFDYAFARGQEHGRLIHAFYISSDVKDGVRVLSPGVATKWGLSSNGLIWTLTIRKGVKFHNGMDVTMEDVLWSLQHNFGPQAKEYALSGAAVAVSPLMDRIEQTGPDQISIFTTVPIPDLAGTMSEAAANTAGIYPKRATLHDEQEELAYDKNPIGAGIMRLVKHIPSDSMTFERFDDYYHQPKNGFPTDKRVNFTLLDLRLIPEEATRVAALRAGEADIVPVSLLSRRQVESGGGHLVSGLEGSTFVIRLHGCWKEIFPCHDKRVRQALAYAIDKEVIRNQLYGGPQVMELKGWGLTTPSTVGYSPVVDAFPFDPFKAQQLLADAGYPGGKGFGKLVINTWKGEAIPLLPESAQLGADNWRRTLGLDVEVKLWEAAALKKISSLSEDLHGQIVWRDNETRLDAGGILRSFYGTPDKLERMHNDPELFALVNEALAVFTPVEREKALNSVYRRLRDEAYDIGIGYINIPWGVGPRIRTWEPYPLAFYASALHTITLK